MLLHSQDMAGIGYKHVYNINMRVYTLVTKLFELVLRIHIGDVVCLLVYVMGGLGRKIYNFTSFFFATSTNTHQGVFVHFLKFIYAVWKRSDSYSFFMEGVGVRCQKESPAGMEEGREEGEKYEEI